MTWTQLNSCKRWDLFNSHANQERKLSSSSDVCCYFRGPFSVMRKWIIKTLMLLRYMLMFIYHSPTEQEEKEEDRQRKKDRNKNLLNFIVWANRDKAHGSLSLIMENALIIDVLLLLLCVYCNEGRDIWRKWGACHWNFIGLIETFLRVSSKLCSQGVDRVMFLTPPQFLKNWTSKPGVQY